MDQSAAAVREPAPTNHPVGFYYIFFGEFAERCSYYGMRAILALYLTSVLQYEVGNATEIQSYFKAACYLLPLLGGFLADRYFGKYWTIVGFSVPYVLGHFILGIENRLAMVIALGLLAGGSGVIKPNISTLMGMTYDQKRPGQAGLRSAAFLWFYFSINIGAVLSQYGLPELRRVLVENGYALNQAYKVAFMIPTILMVISLGIFAAGKRHYAVEVIDRNKVLTPEERRQRWHAVSTLFGIFALISFFWMAYEQNDNLWVYFARDHVNLTVNMGFFEKTFEPDGFQFVNALSVLFLAPFFAWLFRRIDPTGKRFPAPIKIFFGFLCTAATSGLMALAAYSAAGGEKVSGWWMILGYFSLTVGEVLVYGTGLELAFTAAPANMKGFITGCFLLTNTIGNLFNARFAKLYETEMAAGPFFALTASIVVGAAILFFFVGRRFSHPDEASTPQTS